MLMKNIVNRALVAKKKQFLSKSVPRGTRTIWRYLSAFILLFSLSIGQMWATDLTITGYMGGSTTTGSVKIHTDTDNMTAICKFANSWSSGANFYSIKTAGGFKSGDVLNFTGAYSNSSSKNAKFVIYAANKTTSLYTSASNVVNGKTSADDPTAESYTLTSDQDSLLFARDGNTGLFLLTLTVSRTTSGPVDPTITFNNSNYTIDGADLDLSSLFTSNSEGDVTYSIKNANGTGAALRTDGKSFYATIAGTATVTASQAEETGKYNAGSADATITVLNPCTKPSAPTSLGVTSKTHNTANLSWDGGSAGANGYQIALVSASGAGTFDWTDATSATYEATGLTPETAYTFKVKYKGSGEQCAFSDEVTKDFTTDAAPAPVAPDVVLNNNGTLNSTDFVTLVSELDGDDYSVSSVAYTNNFKFGNTCSSIVNQSWSNKYLAYDVKTTSATLKLYVYNKNSNSKNLYYQVLSETGNGDFKTESITSRGDGKIIEIPVTATKGTRVVFGANSTDVRICQLEVYENGTTLTKAGEVGYELALKGRPFATGSSNLFSGNIDGMEYVLYSELKLVNNNAYSVMRNNDGTHYFKIPATNDVQLKVTTDNSAKFYVLGSAVAGDPDEDVQYGGEAGTFNVNLPHKDGYWYIIPVVAATGTGNEVRISKIAFATMPAGLSVTYNAGEGAVKEGKSLPTHADAYEGDKIVLASGENLEKSGYDFTGWKANGTGDLLLPGDKYTMTDAPVEFVAQWTLHVAKYGVKFMDGTTKLDSLSVTLGQAPVFADPTQALYTFAGWKDGDDNDVTLSDLATSVTVEDTKLVLYAQWNKVYVPQGTSYVFENTATLGTAPNAITVTKDNNPNAIAANSRIDNMWLSAMSVKLEDGTYSGSGDDFKGWKINTASATIRFFVENDSRVTVTVGNLTSGLNITYTAKNATEEATTALTAKAANPYDVKGGTLVTLTTGGGSTVTLKGIAVSAIPALDDDATLSDLKVGGVTVAGFSANTHTYYYELPYGTAVGDIPAISATANSAKAKQVAIEQAVWTGDPYNCYRAQANVQAEDESWGYYDVQFSFAPKYGVELIKATHDGTASGATITGYIGGQKDKDTYANGKLGEIGKYFGIKLADGNFQAGDLVEVKVSMFEGGNTATMFTDKGETLLSSGAFDVNNKVYRFTLTAETEWIYIYRKDGTCNPRVQSIAVYRQMNPFIEEFKIGEAVGTITGTDIAVEVPYAADLEHLTPTVKAWANGGATVTPTGEQDFTSAQTYTVSSAYTEDADVVYTVTVTKAAHYEAMIVGGASYTTLAGAVAVAEANATVKLLDNVDLMTTGLTIAENITLDLNGFNIKAGEQIDNDILVPAGKKLTLVDNSENHLGKIYTEQAYTGAVTGYGLIRVAGELLMQSGNIYAVIESDPANLGQFAVVLGAGGKATIEGGQIKAGWYAISNNGNNTGSTIIVSGGELISTADFAIYNPAKESTVTVSGGVVYGAAGGIAMNRGELTVTGGTITSKDQGTTGTWGDGTGGMSNAAIAASGKYESVEVEISGGTIIAEGTAVMITNGTTNPVEVAISGGQFSHVVPAEYCAEGFAPVTTPNAQGKYEVIALGVIRGQAVQDPTTEVYSYTLDNGVVIYASNSDGKLSTSTMTATSSDVVACGGDEGGHNVNKSAFVLQFPVNVKEFTLYGANSNERTISKVYVNAEASKDIKIKDVGRELTGTYTNTKDEKCQTLTAVYDNNNVIPAGYYVLVTLSGSVNFYRVLYTEAECTDPVITMVNNTVANEGESATVSVDVTALGATYQWYTCDDELGTNPQIIDGATAASYTFTKGTGVEYFKVVVGCNCSAVTVSAVAKAEVWAPTTTLVDVTENTVWDWTIVTQDVNGDAIDASNGPKLNTTNGMIIGNYIIGNNFDKVEGNDGAFAIRNASNKYYQGASLHMHTTVSGYLKIHARNDGNTMTLSVQNAGRDMSLGSLGNWKDYTVYVQAGDVVIYNVPETAGKPMRIDQMTFTVDETPDYTRNVTSNFGTLCVEKNVVVGGALGATFYQIASRNEDYDYKIDFEEVLPNEELKAGEPYIFQSTTGRIDLFYGETVADDPVAVRGMIGSFVNANVDIDEFNKNDILYIANNKLWNCENLVGSHLNVVANRAYIVMSDVPTYAEYQAAQTSNPAPRRRVTLGKDAEQVATGCENVNVSDKPVKMIINGQLFILRGEKMYDAKGQLVK